MKTPLDLPGGPPRHVGLDDREVRVPKISHGAPRHELLMTFRGK